jgi:hypothetical protein
MTTQKKLKQSKQPITLKSGGVDVFPWKLKDIFKEIDSVKRGGVDLFPWKFLPRLKKIVKAYGGVDYFPWKVKS